MAKTKILVIDDEKDIGWLFSKILKEEGYQVLIAHTGIDGISITKQEKPDLVILDLKLPGLDGIETLREIRKFDKDLLVIVLTGFETVQSAVEAMKLGAYDYLSKPVNIEKIKTTIKDALLAQSILKKKGKPRNSANGKISFKHIVGESPQMQKIHDLIKRVAAYDITVFLKGESGTGKELVARAIHNMSGRTEMPFVVIDCGRLPDTLVESEIFGHEKGAFTGAHEMKLGKFELAEKGTVFLDEIGNLTAHTQVKLLRALQEREIERLGGKKPIKVDFRLIVATNFSLEKAMADGHFREDLYYRLNVFSISLPPLRERDGDIEILVEYYLKKFNKAFDKSVRHCSPEVMDLLTRYAWPGNVRELRNVLETAVLLATEEICPRHLPSKIQNSSEKNSGFPSSLREVGNNAKKRAEKETIVRILDEVNWNKSRAAKMLEVDYKTLYNKIKDYDIQRI